MFTHTHTPCLWQGGATGNEVKMRMRGKWRWDDLEDEMKNYLNQGAKRGTQKKKERTPTRHTWPGASKPWKGKGKEKRRVDGHGTRPAEGGEGRKRLNQPDTARTYTHLSTRRSRPTWEGRTHEIGTNGDLVGEKQKLKQDSVPKPRSRALCHSRPVFKSCPNWHKTAFKFQRISCTTCFTSPDTKETTPAGKGHACCLHVFMYLYPVKSWSCRTKMEVSDCSERLHLKECRSLGFPGTSGAAGNLKNGWNRKAICFAYLDELLIQKCNSEFKSVDIDPNWGCLNRPYGTMSESP